MKLHLFWGIFTSAAFSLLISRANIVSYEYEATVTSFLEAGDPGATGTYLPDNIAIGTPVTGVISWDNSVTPNTSTANRAFYTQPSLQDVVFDMNIGSASFSRGSFYRIDTTRIAGYHRIEGFTFDPLVNGFQIPSEWRFTSLNFDLQDVTGSALGDVFLPDEIDLNDWSTARIQLQLGNSSGQVDSVAYATLTKLTRVVEATTFRVTFSLGSHGTLVSGELIQDVEEGASATEPVFDVDDLWVFSAWDRSFDNITADIVVTALYEERVVAGSLWPDDGEVLGYVGEPFQYAFSSEFNGEVVSVTGLPDGLSFDGAGRITGYPNSPGEFAITASTPGLYPAEQSTTLRILRNSLSNKSYTLTNLDNKNLYPERHVLTTSNGEEYEVGLMGGKKVTRGGLTLSANNGIYIFKKNADGDSVFLKRISGSDRERDLKVELGENNSIVMATTRYEGPNADSYVIVRKAASSGSLIWKRESEGGNVRLKDLLVNDSGEIFIGGEMNSKWGFIVYTIEPVGFNGIQEYTSGWDGFLVGYTASGNVRFFNAIGGNGDDKLNRLVPFDNDTFVITGKFEDIAYIGPSKYANSSVVAAKNKGEFVARCDSAGKIIWSSVHNNIIDVKLGEDGYLYVGDDESITKLDNWGNPIWYFSYYVTTEAFASHMISINASSSGTVYLSLFTSGSIKLKSLNGISLDGVISNKPALHVIEISKLGRLTSHSFTHSLPAGVNFTLVGSRILHTKISNTGEVMVGVEFFDNIKYAAHAIASAILAGFNVQASDPDYQLLYGTYTYAPSFINNLAPVAVDDLMLIEHGQSKEIDARLNDSDADGDALRIVAAETDSQSLNILLNESKITVQSNNDFSGTATIVYTLEDTKGQQATGNVIVVAGMTETDRGWRREPIASLGTYAQIALDQNDTPHASILTSSGIVYLQLTESGWVNETIPMTANSVLKSLMRLDSSGKPHFVYYDSLDLTLYYLYHNGTEWVKEVVFETDNTAITVGIKFDFELNSNNEPVVLAYYSQTPTFAYRNNGNWTTEIQNWISADDFQVEVTGAGTIHSMYAGNNGYLPIFKYNGSWYASESWQIEPQDGAGSFDEFTVYHMLASENEAIYTAYLWNGKLGLAKFENFIVDTSYITTTSAEQLRLSKSGNNIGILGFDNDTGSLVYTTNTSGLWTNRFVVEGGAVLPFPDMKLDSKGSAHIVYFDNDRKALVYAYEEENQAPIAVKDAVEGQYGKNIAISVIDNDFDADGDEINIDSVSVAGNGSATISNDRKSVIYKPSMGFSGSDQFSYRLVDERGAHSEYVVVDIAVPGMDLLDQNVDGVADIWSNYYLISDTALDDDLDGDGVSNRDEYNFGTDPSNSGNVPRLRIDILNADPCLIFPTVDGMIYDVESSSSLTDWAPEGIEFYGSGEEVEIVLEGDLTNNGQRFYRVSALGALDTDSDLLPDWLEMQVANTSPIKIDSDEDGVDDGVEVSSGYNPIDPLDQLSLEFSNTDVVYETTQDDNGAFTSDIKIRVTNYIQSSRPPGVYMVRNKNGEGSLNGGQSINGDMYFIVNPDGFINIDYHHSGETDALQLEIFHVANNDEYKIDEIEVRLLPLLVKPQVSIVNESALVANIQLHHPHSEDVTLFYSLNNENPASSDILYEAGEVLEIEKGQILYCVAFDGTSYSEVTRYTATSYKIDSVASSWGFSAFLQGDGRMQTFGNNSSLALGRTHLSTSILETPGYVYHTPDGASQPQILEDVVNISVGHNHILALINGGNVMAWGYSAENTYFPKPIQIEQNVDGSLSLLDSVKDLRNGYRYSAALKNDGTVWIWSGVSNYSDEIPPASLFQNTTSDSSRHAGKIQGLNNIIDFATGKSCLLAIDGNGHLWGLGDNEYGILSDEPGQVYSTPQRIDLGTTFRRIFVGQNRRHDDGSIIGEYAVAIDTDGCLWTWGDDSYKNLGHTLPLPFGSAQKIEGLVDVIDVSFGAGFAMALSSDGTVYSWGLDYRGETGQGSDGGFVLPAVIPHLPKISKISAGLGFATALSRDGEVFVWGSNSRRQLGLNRDGYLVGAKYPVKLLGLPEMVDIAAGDFHTIARDVDGNIWQWGKVRGATSNFLEPFPPVKIFGNGLFYDPYSSVSYNDSNSNNVDDSWEILYFGRLLELGEELADHDYDSFSTIDEFIYQTTPTDTKSRASDLDYLSAQPEIKVEAQSDGSLSIRFPLEVPPGVNGMQPSLAMQYSSNGRYGEFGIGWTLEGLSQIRRGGTDLKRDGYLDGVDYDENDQFYLDGQRLIKDTAPADLIDSYYVQSEPSIKIEAEGNYFSGPKTFKVWGRDGIVRTYEPQLNEDNSLLGLEPTRGAISYAVTKAEDRYGNWISYSYKKLPVDFLEWRTRKNDVRADFSIESISYGKSGTATPLSTIEFERDLSTVIAFGSDYRSYPFAFSAGEGVAMPTPITRLSIFGKHPFRDYTLKYERSPTGHPRLKTIQPYASDGGRLPEVRFDYTIDDGDTVWTKENTNLPSSAISGIGYTFIDIDGDGFRESTKSILQSNGSIDRSTGGPLVALGYYDNGSVKEIGTQVLDLNGDGRLDIMANFTGYSQSYSKANLRSGKTAEGFPEESWINAPEYIPPVELYRAGLNYGSGIRIADINGDGLDDILLAWQASNGSVERGVYFNTGSGWSEKSSNYIPPIDFAIQGQNFGGAHLIDINSDRLLDIIWASERSGELQCRVWENTGTGWVEVYSKGVIPAVPLDIPIRISDINGDENMDIVILPKDSGYDPNYPDSAVYINTGLSCFIESRFHPGEGWIFNGRNIYMQYGDINGDGLVDRFLRTGDSGIGTYQNIFLNRGNEWQSLSSGSEFDLPVELDKTGVTVTDWNGDGVSDILVPDGTFYSAWINQYGNADVLTKVEIEAGIDYEIKYQWSEAQSDSIYSTQGDSEGLIELQPRKYLVSEISKPNPAKQEGRHIKKFEYESYVFMPGEEKSPFFKEWREIDDETGIVRELEFSTDPGTWGRVVRESVFDSFGQPITETLNQWSSKGYSSTGFNPYLVCLVSKSVSSYESDGNSYISFSSATDYLYDEYGNIVESNQTFLDGSRILVENEYYNDENNWIIGRLYKAKSTHFPASGSALPSISNFAEFKYNSEKGSLIEEVSEPGTVNELITAYEHDKYGNVIEKIVSGHKVPSASDKTYYDSDGRFPVAVINALGHRRTVITDPITFFPKTTVTASGERIDYEYDGVGRTVSKTNPDGVRETTSYFYLESPVDGLAGAVYKRVSQVADLPPVVTYFDILGRAIATKGTAANGEIVEQHTFYNAHGLEARKSLPVSAGGNLYETAYRYDARGRLQETEDLSDGRINSIQRIPRLFDNGTEIRSFVEAMTDAGGFTTYRFLDARRRVVKSTFSKGDINDANTVTFQYDARGNPLLTETMGFVTTKTFDNADNMLTMTNPDTGLQVFEYDALGRVSRMYNDADEHTFYEYDAIGRIVRRATPDRTEHYTYDLTKNSTGRLSRVESSDGHSISYQYNDAGQLVAKTVSIDDVEYLFQYSYDRLGRMSKVFYPTGYTIERRFNAAGALESIYEHSGKLLWRADAYNDLGQLTSTSTGDGSVTEYEYLEQRGLLSRIATDSIQLDMNYTYDGTGNPVGRRENALEQSRDIFTYDEYNRLQSWSRIDQYLGAEQIKEWEFDALHRLSSEQIKSLLPEGGFESISSVTYSYLGQSHQLEGVNKVTASEVISPQYDAKGNRSLSVANEGLEYNAANKPLTVSAGGVTKEVFRYGIGDRLLARTEAPDGNARKTTYIDRTFDLIEDGTSKVFRSHVVANGRTIVLVDQDASDLDSAKEYRYLHRDAIGSVVGVTDNDGNVLSRSYFSPYGLETQISTDTADVDYAFTGHIDLAGDTLVHAQGRLFDSMSASFVSPDIVVQSPLNPVSYNRYAYTQYRPLTFTDSTGYFIDNLEKVMDSTMKGIGYKVAYHATGSKHELLLKQSKAHFKYAENLYVNGVVKPLVITAITVQTGIWLNGAVPVWFEGAKGVALKGAVVGGATAGFNTALYGGNTSEILDSMERGALQGAAYGYVSKAIDGEKYFAAKVAAHGAIGGTFNEIYNTGTFSQGFITSGATKALSPVYEYFAPGSTEADVAKRVAMAGVAGGVMEHAQGGSFSNGAFTAAYSRLLNTEQEEREDSVEIEDDRSLWERFRDKVSDWFPQDSLVDELADGLFDGVADLCDKLYSNVFDDEENNDQDQ